MDEDIVMAGSDLGQGSGFGNNTGHSRRGPTRVRGRGRDAHVHRAGRQRDYEDSFVGHDRPVHGRDQWTHDRYQDVDKRVNSQGGDTLFTRISRNGPHTASPLGTVVIKNLHYEQTVEDLTRLFRPYGNIFKGPFITYDRADRPTGDATITFHHLEDAQAACQAMQGKVIADQKITLQVVARQAPGAHRERTSLLSRLGQNTGQRSREPYRRPHNTVPYSRKPDRSSGMRSTQDDLDRELEQYMKQGT